MKRTQATLSIWDAIIESKACRQAVLEALSKITVSALATLDDIVASINETVNKINNVVTFPMKICL